MLCKVKENIIGANPFALGDSAAEGSKDKFAAFFDSLDRLMEGEEKFTVILDDPGGPLCLNTGVGGGMPAGRHLVPGFVSGLELDEVA